MVFHQALVLGIVLFAATGKAQVDFSYEGEDGPDHWAELYPMCGGSRQSPVNIQEDRTKKSSSPALWLYYPGSIPWEANLTNNGHTALLKLNPALPITLHGGPLSAPYVFQQLHFHWGSNDSVGSEHAINSHFSTMEMHMVFYKDEYGSPSNAAKYSDGFTVLSVLLDHNENGNPVLPPVVWALQRIQNYGDVTNLDTGLALESLLPNDRHLYYTYPGSLTTPPCDEAVTWIIFRQHVPISSEQVAAFHTLKTEDGSLLTSNRRPLQPLGNRTVSLVSFSSSRRRGSATRRRGQHGRRRQ
ncbi:carbonic anhydrase 1-like [Schistocerca gregaria]|uniref:carbonic anhydrase 1-like n=1 Tax=Schistocerca gregaria TaxID=7010 RepID=UPI00211E926D|nr:carbonic anhydrase 1-like [Schistocerca gregaria]